VTQWIAWQITWSWWADMRIPDHRNSFQLKPVQCNEHFILASFPGPRAGVKYCYPITGGCSWCHKWHNESVLAWAIWTRGQDCPWPFISSLFQQAYTHFPILPFIITARLHQDTPLLCMYWEVGWPRGWNEISGISRYTDLHCE